MDPDATILGFYEDRYDEIDRLERPPGRLERLRTQDLLQRHLPAPPARILDVGGGPGVYARWLVDLAYEVRLIDVVERHVTEAKGAGLAAVVGDARSLDEADDSADAVLLLGPLYHLPERDDRLRALAEAARVVRPGGVVAVGAISRFAALLDGGLRHGFLEDSGFAAIAEQSTATGHHRNPTEHPDWFTTAYFHRPDELRAEVGEVFGECVVYGLEGAGFLLHDLGERLDDPDRCRAVLDAARIIETEPSLAGLSPHLLAVATRS